MTRAAPRLCLLALVALTPASAAAQPAGTPEPATLGAPAQATASAPPLSALAYTPITGSERATWIVVRTIGARSLGVGVMVGAWQTGIDVPPEWGRTWSGFGKRYAQREAKVAISNTIEAGLGALWDEDPRYIRSGRQGIWPRARYAMKTVVLAERRDGRLAPAWGRYAGNAVNNLVENTWLPPSATTWEQTALRSVNGVLGRLAGNLWEEFWPDARRLLFRKR